MKPANKHFHILYTAAAVALLNTIGYNEAEEDTVDSFDNTLMIAIDAETKEFFPSDMNNIPAGSVFTTFENIERWKAE